jgi:glutathione S-transferase
MPAKLYVLPASHPCETVAAALRHKGVPYERVDLIPQVHRIPQTIRFGGRTVPAIVFEDGEKVQGSRAIIRALERRVPEPALLPGADPARRRAIEEGEAWGDAVLQPLARRVIWSALRRRPDAIPSYSAGADLPVPDSLARLSAPLVARLSGALNHASDNGVRADLANLELHLQRVDAWIGDGVLGAEQPNAADLQIGSGLALLRTLADLRERIDAHPAGDLARRWFREYPGHTPAGALPAAWLR